MAMHFFALLKIWRLGASVAGLGFGWSRGREGPGRGGRRRRTQTGRGGRH